MERTLSNTTADQAKASGWIVDKGDPNAWECVSKAHFDGGDGEPHVMKSTKRMAVPGGFLYSVTTEIRDYVTGQVACAEALAFVPAR